MGDNGCIPKNEEDVENVRFDDLTEREITSGPVALDWWLQGANFLWDIFFSMWKRWCSSMLLLLPWGITWRNWEMSGYNNNPRHNNYHFQSWFYFDPELHFLLFMAPVTGFVIRLGRNSCTGDLYVFATLVFTFVIIILLYRWLSSLPPLSSSSSPSLLSFDWIRTLW